MENQDGNHGNAIHTFEQERVMREYKDAVNSDVRTYIEDVIKGNDGLKYISVGTFPVTATTRIRELTQKEVEGSAVVLDRNAVNHIIKRHGENGIQDHSMKNIDDLARIGYVINNYDLIEYEDRTTTAYLDENGKPSPMVKISKRIDGTYYVIEAVNSSKKKRNYIVSAFIKKAENEETAL